MKLLIGGAFAVTLLGAVGAFDGPAATPGTFLANYALTSSG